MDITRPRKGASALERAKLVAEPQRRRRYTLDELLAQCNPKARRDKEEQEWLDSRPGDNELI